MKIDFNNLTTEDRIKFNKEFDYFISLKWKRIFKLSYWHFLYKIYKNGI